jgi:endonuclease-3 related protein
LEQLVRSAGYFRQKAQRLKNFVAYLDERHGGSLDRMFAIPTRALRQEVLDLNGVGPETADAILLYAGGHPVFVVDVYTRRLFDRHKILPLVAKYEEVRHLVEEAFMDADNAGGLPTLPDDIPMPRWRKPGDGLSSELAQAYNEFHALIVTAGKRHCWKAEAKCEACPLERFVHL